MPSFTPPKGVPVLFSCIVPGRALVKKNHRPIHRNHRTGSPYIGKSDELRAYENLLISTFGLAYHLKPIDTGVWVVTRVFLDTRKSEPDLGGPQETVWDCLAKAGIIVNDRLIESQDGSRKYYDPKGGSRLEVHVMPFKS